MEALLIPIRARLIDMDISPIIENWRFIVGFLLIFPMIWLLDYENKVIDNIQHPKIIPNVYVNPGFEPYLEFCQYALHDTPIYSLRSGNEIQGHGESSISGHVSGSFFLGFGSGSGSISGSGHSDIGESSFYYFYVRDSRGGYTLSKVNAFDIVLIQNSSMEPSLREVVANDTRGVMDHNGLLPMVMNAEQETNLQHQYCREPDFVTIDGYWDFSKKYLIVPEGTITEDFKVN
jgi:hypothetical protein